MPPVPSRRQQDQKIDTQINVARHERARTIVYSMLAAGFVSLFIGHFIEVDTNNAQADRSRTNCQFLNERVKVSGERLVERADKTLGNPNHKDKNGNPDPIPPLQIKGTAFEKFGPLIIANAKQDRQDGLANLQGVKDCKAVFPKQKHFWIVG
jgi:hypothetical protein